METEGTQEIALRNPENVNVMRHIVATMNVPRVLTDSMTIRIANRATVLQMEPCKLLIPLIVPLT